MNKENSILLMGAKHRFYGLVNFGVFAGLSHNADSGLVDRTVCSDNLKGLY